MSGESENLVITPTYSELQAIDQEDIILLIDVESAVNVCNECITEKSANPSDVLTLWFSKLLRAYISESVDCVKAVKEMCKWFQLECDSCKEICSAHIKLFKEALAFITAYRDNLLKAGERLVQIFTYLQLSLIDLFVKTRTEDHQLLKDLQFSVLFLLKEITSKSKKVHPRNILLMQKVMEIADHEREKFRDFELPAKTSETITQMCVHYMSCVDLNEEPIPEWLKETVSHLCEMVLSYLEDLNKRLNFTANELEELFKVLPSYLLMLKQIFKNGVIKIDQEVAAYLMDLIMCQETRPSHYSIKNLQNLITTYVRPNIMKLFQLAYCFCECQKYFLTCVLVQQEGDYFDACIDFVSVVSTDDSDILPFTCRTLQKVFEYFFKDVNIFVNDERYEQVIDAFGSLLYMVAKKELHSYFLAGLFQKDIIKSQVCADILMLCFRLKEVNNFWTPNTVEQAINFWQRCNNLYAMFSQNPSQLHVQRFLKYFQSLGRQGIPALSIQNFRQLSTVLTADAQIGIKLLKRLDEITSALPTQVNVYYEIASLLELLVSQDTDCSQWFQRTSEMSKDLMSIASCNSFTSAYFKLLVRANKATQLLVLRGLAPTNGCTNWHQQKFIEACKISDDAQLRAFSVHHTIPSDFQQLLQVLRQKPEDLDSSVDVSLDDFSMISQWVYTRDSEHKCQGSSLKRKREEVSHKQILHDIYEGTLQLSKLSGNFDAADWDLHKRVLTHLGSILPGL
ncbi:uncharacterized protein LOC108090566 isoform X2 [Drosophila ficusphila]|uniref:uncharacterized protein LOC108090566 isoform X2 n=1 Tax=Drosophila ficusphila TaxID=30025 RepID=UPI0007E5E58D|nr:uncharacterized protein LOC108090566 isoform X2 [Drosophila ficusphila]